MIYHSINRNITTEPVEKIMYIIESNRRLLFCTSNVPPIAYEVGVSIHGKYGHISSTRQSIRVSIIIYV